MKLNSSILAKLFRTNVIEINKFCKNKLKNPLNFRYLNYKENNDLIITILNRIFSDTQIVGSRGRKNRWFRGWDQTFDDYKKNKNINSLLPKFYTARENKFFRLGGKFIKVKNQKFEIKILDIYRNWYFKKYFSKVDNIYEFGAGTGHNLVELSKVNLNSFYFDMLKPNHKVKLLNNSAIYTSGAVEQLSGNIDKFLKYIVLQRPRIILHVEPCIDFYDDKNLTDYLGKMFQTRRKYTSNLLSKLKNLEKKGDIKIVKVCKSPFGSLMMEGYNLIVWKIND